MAAVIRMNLANKCLLFFGSAVVLLLIAALMVVGVRMQWLVEQGPLNKGRTLAEAYLQGHHLLIPMQPFDEVEGELPPEDEQAVSLISREDFQRRAQDDPFLAEAIREFDTYNDAVELFTEAIDAQGGRYYRFVRAIRKSDLLDASPDPLSMLSGLPPSEGGFRPKLDTTWLADPVEMILLVQLRDRDAATQMMLNQIYIVAAGLFAGLLAIAAFWFITARIILSPVRLLRFYAQKVSEGDLNLRADLNTGDEFQQLSDMFNLMLQNLKAHQDELRSMNKSLGLKLGELAESNVALDEANKIKGEFLANVSHELRTPLNSILGFAELLQETLPADPEQKGPTKSQRYAGNIVLSSRRLLDLINDLLDLAKIEAGRMDVHLAPTSIADTCEGLITLMRPQADPRRIRLETQVPLNLPPVQTDAGKLQQVIFNFLANAIKFSPDGGTVTLKAALHTPTGISGPPTHLRISVTDQGPGISEQDQERIFDKFTQLDPSTTKQHGGTGLGLTISRNLAELLQGRIDVDSLVGHGATFRLTLPLRPGAESSPLMPEMRS